MKLWARSIIVIAMLMNMLTYAYYSFSFAARPDDMPRSACAIIAAIYFVGIALFLNQQNNT